MFSTIESLRLRALALRSSIHNEQQLTAVELAAMNAKKTNEIIDVVNELCVACDKILSAAGVDLVWNPETESLDLTVVTGGE